MESKGYMVNGIIFKIHSAVDFEKLILNEGASEIYKNTPSGQMYKLTNVADNVHPANDMRKVFTFASPKDKSSFGRPLKNYIRKVYKGIKPWGDNFERTFLETGGLKPSNFLSGILPFHRLFKFMKLRGMK